MSTRHRTAVYFLFPLIYLLLATGSALAISFESEENIHISNLHRIDDDLIAWGSSVTVDGLIEGDLIAGCYTLNTNGHIRGSQNVFAFKFHHTGRVEGALRGFVNLIEIDGSVGRSILLAGNDIRIGEKSWVEKDVVLRGNTVHIDGLIKGNADVEAETIFLGGTIHGDALLKAKEIKILVPAVIKGDLTYFAEKEDALELAPGVIVLGNTEYKGAKTEDEKKSDSESVLTSAIVQTSKTLAAFLFGIILLSLFNKYALEAANQLRTRFAVATAAGLLSIIIVIISLLILFLSLLLVAIGGIMAGGESALAGAVVLSLSILMVPITSFVTVSGAVLFYSGKIIVGVLIGYLLLRLIKPNAVYLSRFQLLVGLILLTVVFSLPFVGYLLYLALSTIGAGAIVLGVKYCRRELNQSTPPELGKDS